LHNDLPRPGEQRAITRQLSVTVKAPLSTWVYLPPSTVQAPATGWPVVFFLHGSGERGSDPITVKVNGLPKLLDHGLAVPAIVVSPQAPTDGWWDPHLLHALLLQLKSELPIDARRVTATGLSMGGRGAWAWAIEYPQDLAAIAPISGEGDEDRMARIRHLPVWAFHGEADDVVPFDIHRRAIDALREAGGQPRFTTYPGVGHDAWTASYNNPALMAWLLAQVRAETAR
jgi:predicted peptidase